MTAETTATATLQGVRIDGEPVDPAEPWRVPVVEPATGQVLTELAGGGRAEAEAAAASARKAFAGWAEKTNTQRAGALHAIAADLLEEPTAERIARLISQETGKRIAESRAEVGLSAKFFDWFASAVATRHATAWSVVPGIEHRVVQRPVGIVAVLTPWNFPASIPARKIAPALAAGCPVLFKPSEVAPSSALLLAKVVERHLPRGVLNTVVGEPLAVSGAWIGDPDVRGLTFTGSTRVGQALAAQTAPHFTRCVLELGGNAPFVVLDDADLDRAVELLMVAKYRNNGQSCIAANQVWVPREKAGEFADRFSAASANLRLGDPLDEGTDLGPLALPDDPSRIGAVVDEAAAAGATVLRPGPATPGEGHFAAPTVCVHPGEQTRMVTEEIFGPAVSVRGYGDTDEVLAATRAAAHGLGGYVVGSQETAASIATALDVGIVGVNNASPNTPQIPFGGLKHSGLGWEGGEVGLDAFLTNQTVAVAPR